ncbi:MAG: restriction endonuclease subunit S, partial [Truepera sp.]|nr:restriction endonuclease subunit S [Truepera sp.]
TTIPLSLPADQVANDVIAFNQDIKAVVPRDDLSSEFLFWALKHLGPVIEAKGVGATVKGVTLQAIKDLQIPLPPLDEQWWIVGVLNRVAKIERLRVQAAERLREFIPALFTKMFGSGDRIGNRFPCLPLREVAAVGSGATKGRKIALGESIEVPYLRVANVQDGFLDLNEIKTIRIKRSEREKYQLAPGDLLMTEGGDPDKLGRAAIWTGELDYCAHQNHVFRVRPSIGLIQADYLREVIGSSYGKGYFLSAAKQTTGIASINKTQLENFPVPVPPIELQTRYAQTIAGASNIAATAVVGSIAASELRTSIMANLLTPPTRP